MRVDIKMICVPRMLKGYDLFSIRSSFHRINYRQPGRAVNLIFLNDMFKGHVLIYYFN